QPQAAASPSPETLPQAQPSPSKPEENSAQSATPEASPGEDEAQSNDEENGGDNEDDNEPEEPENAADEAGSVKMNPEMDQQFAQLASARISHSKFRYYLLLPYKRAVSLWFDTHSQYYPFEGELLPLDDMDHTTHQHIWLPLFTALTWFYTLLGIAGAWI